MEGIDSCVVLHSNGCLLVEHPLGEVREDLGLHVELLVVSLSVGPLRQLGCDPGVHCDANTAALVLK